MKVIHLLKVLQRHLLLIIIVPVLLASIVYFLTRKKQTNYLSETTIYTGIASGYSFQLEQRIDVIAAYDNFINLIRARQTLEEVSVCLIVQHLMLDHADARYISRENWEDLLSKVPPDVMDIVKKEKRKDRKLYRPPSRKTSYYDSIGDNPSQSQTSKNDLIEPSSTNRTIDSYHVVKRGETVYSIAKKYGLSSEDLKSHNSLTNNSIAVGQRLLVAQNKFTPQPSPVANEEEPEPTPATDELSTDTTSAIQQYYNISTETQSPRTREFIDTTSSFERAVRRLLIYARQNDYNFIYKLWSSDDPFYSIKALSKMSIERVQNSDLVTISYINPDPGICQYTLIFLTKVFIRSYKLLKQNQTDAVIAYFKRQLEDAMRRLQKAENDLLIFNSKNNIINYYEQTKAIAGEKEALDVDYQNKQIAYAAADAAIKIIEKKLETHAQLTINTTTIMRLRNELADATMQIANIEIDLGNDSATINQLSGLKAKVENIKLAIKDNIDRLYRANNSVEGLPINNLLAAWLNNVISYEESKAALRVLAERKKQFQRTYEIFAPLGAEMKRFERLIGVTESEFLQLLHDLNLAKLRQQDDELATNIKLVDSPYFPLTPQRSRALLIVFLAGFLGLVLIIALLIAMEYFDTTIKTPERAERFIKLKVAGAYPKIIKQIYSVDIGFIIPRLVEMIIQNMKLALTKSNIDQGKKPVYILVFSTRYGEGKTTIARELCRKMKSFGENVLYLNYLMEQTNVSTYLPDSELIPQTDDEIQYPIKDNFVEIKNIQEIMQGYEHLDCESFDYIFVEIPSIINNSYPVEFIKLFNLALFVVRANRSWTDADVVSLDAFKDAFPQTALIVLNGIEIDYLDTIFGEVPKQRSKFRRTIKRILLLQFRGKI